VFTAVVTGGPRLGDVEAGAVAAVWGTQASVVSGGLACIAGVGVLVWRVPELWRHDAGDMSRAGEREAVVEAVMELTESEPG
jgi:hypothetical protein